MANKKAISYDVMESNEFTHKPLFLFWVMSESKAVRSSV